MFERSTSCAFLKLLSEAIYSSACQPEVCKGEEFDNKNVPLGSDSHCQSPRSFSLLWVRGGLLTRRYAQSLYKPSPLLPVANLAHVVPSKAETGGSRHA